MAGFGENKKSKKKNTSHSKQKFNEDQILNKAINYHYQGNIFQASKLYKFLIDKGSHNGTVFTNYGLILINSGKLKDAELFIRKAIELNPKDFVAYSNLGGILKDQGKLKDAELFIRKAIELNPNFAKAYYNLGVILQGQDKLEDAEKLYRKAIELNPNFADAYSNLGNVLRDLSKLKDAEFSYRKAIELNPNHTDAYFNLFHHYEEINNLEKLKESLNEFSKIVSIKNELLLFRSRLSFRKKEQHTAKKLIDNITSEWIEKCNISQNIIFWNYKALIEDKIGNYDFAYSCFEKSQKNPSYDKFSKDSFLENINSFKNNILKKGIRFNTLDDAREDYNLAFLIGFPRSGTTLLDTILRSHQDIEVLEEKPLIYTIQKLIEEKFNTKLDNLYSLSGDNVMFLRKKYYGLIKKYKNKEASLIIDKLPLHTISLPLINHLFPSAKIIFTHRHPYDTVLSCFQQSFKPNRAMANLVSLQSSSIMYDQVMNAWDLYKNNLPLDFVTSKYEDLIKNFDNHTLKILDFLGIEWDENMKNYRKTAIERDKINTPSSSQVVQPLYKSSINKWKNYEKYFENCHQYLDKWVSYFDY